MFGNCSRSKGGAGVHTIIYFSRIRKRGWLGIPYTALKLRTAHVDDRGWARLRHRRFSVLEMMLMAGTSD